MSQQIILFIEEDQLIAQKENGYSLYLAKKVNEDFTVIWQSKGAVATTRNPSYQYKNTFDITTPSFNVNFTNDSVKQGDVTFTSGGKNLPITTGQTTTLDEYGVFSPARNGGVKSEILINNELKSNPHEILLDSKGNNIWVNRQSGMNVGTATLTPLDQYQLWFGNLQQTGSLIAQNLSNPYVATLKAGDSFILTYNNEGDWTTGEPAKRLSDKEVAELHAKVAKVESRVAA